ncbi:MAG: amidohydrolase family protein [Chloroflexota bacterium]
MSRLSIMDGMMRPLKVVDAHVHLFPERLFRAVRRALREAIGWEFEHGTDPRELWRFLSSNGVERFFLLNYAHKPDMSAELNRWNHETALRLPAAIVFAAIHPLDRGLRDVAREALDDLGLAGFKLHLDVMGLAPDDPSLFPIYEFAEGRGKPMIVHAGTGGSIRMKGDTLNAARLRRVLKAFPGLRLSVPHLGAMDTASFFDLAEECPNLWFDTSAVLAPEGVCHTEVDKSRVVRLHRRIMFGSDFPNLGHSWEQEVQGVLDLGLDGAGLQRVFHDNALEFVGLL